MKLPVSKVRVAPFDFDVRFDQAAMTAASANGACLEDQLTILLSDLNAVGKTQETLLHECLHAIWGQTRMDRTYPDEDSDSPGEAIINELAPRLLALLRDNPKLVVYLTS